MSRKQKEDYSTQISETRADLVPKESEFQPIEDVQESEDNTQDDTEWADTVVEMYESIMNFIETNDVDICEYLTLDMFWDFIERATS